MAVQDRPVPRGAAATVIGVLAVSNVVTNTRLPSRWYVPWNLALAAGLVALARRCGCDADRLGVAPTRLRPGLRAGATAGMPVAAAYVTAYRSRRGRDAFRDQRVSSLPAATALWHAGVRIPFGTVLAEEVAFRGVLPALLSRPGDGPWSRGPVASSLLFGLWHVLPSRELTRANVAVRRMTCARPARGAALAVAASALAGFVLQALRTQAGHLAAPVLVHLTANLLGFVAARLSASRP